MNSVPAIFYGEVAQMFPIRPKNVAVGRELPGLAGAMFSDVFEKSTTRSIEICNERLAQNGLYSQATNRMMKLEKFPLKYSKISCIRINAADEPCTATPEVINALQACSKKGVNATLDLCTANISQELTECIMSLPGISWLILDFPTLCSRNLGKILQNLLRKKTLVGLVYTEDFPVTASATDFALELLKQDQFTSIQLSQNAGNLLYVIVQEWSKNSEKMTGKSLVFAGKMDARLMDNLRSLRKCSEQETNFLETYYPQVIGLHFKTAVQGFFAKNSQGSKMFWLFAQRQTKLVVLFA